MADRAHADGKPLYVAYIDLKNAFPVTNRDTLWVKLHTFGMSGRVIDWLKLLYSKMEYMVRLNGEYSAPFLLNLGVLTGDPSSPGLWNVFLADFNIRPHPADVMLYGVPLESWNKQMTL
jgi:hypothetical protein